MKTIYNNKQILQQLDSITLHELIKSTNENISIKKNKQNALKKLTLLKKEYPFCGEENYNSILQILTSDTIKPLRYVYHLTRPEKRNSIARFGLQANNSRSKAVFANNQHFSNFLNFYPFIEYFGDPVEMDIWQIDTSIIKSKWHIDPFLRKDPCYICTTENIPPKALRLFKAFPTKAKTTSLHWCQLGSLEIEEIRIEEDASTARFMDRLHYDCSKKLRAA